VGHVLFHRRVDGLHDGCLGLYVRFAPISALTRLGLALTPRRTLRLVNEGNRLVPVVVGKDVLGSAPTATPTSTLGLGSTSAHASTLLSQLLTRALSSLVWLVSALASSITLGARVLVLVVEFNRRIASSGHLAVGSRVATRLGSPTSSTPSFHVPTLVRSSPGSAARMGRDVVSSATTPPISALGAIARLGTVGVLALPSIRALLAATGCRSAGVTTRAVLVVVEDRATICDVSRLTPTR